MTKTIALPLILAATLGLAACQKADTSMENSADMNMTTNDAMMDVNAADASAMSAGNDMMGSNGSMDSTGAMGSTGAMSDNSMSSSSSMNSSMSTGSMKSGSMKNTDMDSAAGNATTDAMHNKE